MSGSQITYEETYKTVPMETTYSTTGPIVSYGTASNQGYLSHGGSIAGSHHGGMTTYQTSSKTTGPSFAKQSAQYSMTSHGSSMQGGASSHQHLQMHNAAHGHGHGHSSMSTHGGAMAMGAHGQTMQVVTPSGSDGRIISVVRGEARETGETHIIATRAGEARFTGEVNIVSSHTGAQIVGSQTVGHEKGAERQISVTEVHVGDEVLGQKTAIVGKGLRGRKVIREEVIEKVIIVPETIQVEEWVEDEYEVEETVIDVAKKYQIEKTVEVAEVEIVEKIIEQIETIVKEKVIEVPKIETIEKIVEVPVIQTVEKIVEFPEIQYNDVPVEKIVEIPEYHTEEIIREVKNANFVEKAIEQKKLIADTKAHARKLPVPVEAETIVEFTVPSLRANYMKKKFPVYLPRFIEVPISRQFVDAGIATQNEKYAARLHNLMTAGHAVSLCEIEKLASEYKDFENRNRLTQKKLTMGANVDDHTKRSMFERVSGGSLEQYAVYKMLPVTTGDLHMGRYNTASLGSCITYSSSQFGSTQAIGGSSRQMASEAHYSHSYSTTPALTTHSVRTSVNNSNRLN